MDSAHRIRLARRHAGLSQTQLAQKVGVRRSAVSHWESSDGKNPNVAHLRAIATIAQVQFEWLATGRGAMSISTEQVLDSVSVADAVLVEDVAELRLIGSFRALSTRSRTLCLELIELMAAASGGRLQRTRLIR